LGKVDGQVPQESRILVKSIRSFVARIISHGRNMGKSGDNRNSENGLAGPTHRTSLGEHPHVDSWTLTHRSPICGEEGKLLLEERLRRFGSTIGSLSCEAPVNRPRFGSSQAAPLQKFVGGSANRTGRTKPFLELICTSTKSVPVSNG
jgi:hypothetical protein